MGSLKYSKKIIIKNKIFKEEDVLLLAKTIQEQFLDSPWRCDVTVRFDDDSRIRGCDTDVFSADAFKRRQSKSIDLEYASAGYKNYCKLELNNAAIWRSESEIEVESTDLVWYESMLKRLETIIDEVEPQKRIMNDPYVLAVILSFVEALVFAFAMSNFTPGGTAGGWILLTVSCAMILTLLNMRLMDSIKKAYPSVEFAFGPMHRNTSFKRKKIIGILVPFLIDVAVFVLGLLA